MGERILRRLYCVDMVYYSVRHCRCVFIDVVACHLRVDAFFFSLFFIKLLGSYCGWVGGFVIALFQRTTILCIMLLHSLQT